MPTVTIPRTDITSEQISAASRDGLDGRYDVLPGMPMTRILTDTRITPGGVAGDLLMYTRDRRKIRHVLLDAPGIGS